MADEIFKGIDQLRMVLDTETDADSPDNQTTYLSVVQMIEALFLLGYATGTSGTATSDPPNDTTGYFYDTGAGFVDDEHNGRTLVITSGSAKGNFYTIDDTVAASDYVACTDDNLYADGVRSGDDYIILYDLKANTDGHDHDGVNSKEVVLEKGRTTAASFYGTAPHYQGGSGWKTAIDLQIYVPKSANSIYGTFNWCGNTTYGVRVRLASTVSNTATYLSRNSTSYTWEPLSEGLDMSAIDEGWKNVHIETFSTSSIVQTYIKGYTLVWGP